MLKREHQFVHGSWCYLKETAFASLIGSLFIPALNITAPEPVGRGFIRLLPSVKMAILLSFISFSSLVTN